MGRAVQVNCFRLPLPVTDEYGSTDNRKKAHTGVDVGATKLPLENASGSDMIITGKGLDTQTAKDSKAGGGYWITYVVASQPDKEYRVFHLAGMPTTAVGATIKPGESMGAISGNTGRVTGAGGGYHGHIEVWDRGKVGAKGHEGDPLAAMTGRVQGGARGAELANIEGVAPLSGVPLVSTAISGKILEETEVKLVDYTNLDNEEWWKKGLVGNPHLKRIPAPVVFKISLSELTNEFLPMSEDDDSPLEIRLNCSLSTVQQQMKHVINKANSRTGFHMTFWGMEPDTITGSGSTGIFMNSFGLTSLMSLTNTDSDFLDEARYLFGEEGDFDELVNRGTFRVAAQDAFVELLSLFKNNGMVRFKTDNYTGAFDNRTQLEKSVWSTQYGSSTYERKARNNDIMTKGQVYMLFKGNVYQGYFKSFSWTMDAATPFHWKFDFIFQIQRSINYVMYTLV